jgi:thymidylate synthase (FAD)
MAQELKSTVKKIWSTPDGEKLIAYCARVSSTNQENPDIQKLLEYCFKHKHFSIFEMANFCAEIITSRAIAQQIIRHRSFTFQEFSQRYADVSQQDEPFQKIHPRVQDTKNRQNSFDTLSEADREWFYQNMQNVEEFSMKLYKDALARGIAKESARFFLPLNTTSKIYMNGSVRSWIHYFLSRLHPSTQLEHRLVAQELFREFQVEYPIISSMIQIQHNSDTGNTAV